MYWKDRTAGHKYFENLDWLPAEWTTALIAFIKGHPELNWVRQINCNNTVIVIAMFKWFWTKFSVGAPESSSYGLAKTARFGYRRCYKSFYLEFDLKQ